MLNLKIKEMIKILKIWSHNTSYSAFTSEKGETIISLHTLAAIKLISQLADKLQGEVKKALNLKEGVPLRSVAKTLGSESDDLYKSVLSQALDTIKGLIKPKPTDGPMRINFLVGSTKEYPADLHIFVRLAGTSVEWVDE